MSLLTVDAVEKHFADDRPRLRKGIDAVLSGHLMECREDRTIGVLFGGVQAGQKTRSYTVKVRPEVNTLYLFWSVWIAFTDP